MNLLGILSLLLIVTSSVLCGRIRRENIDDVGGRDSADMAKMNEENVQSTSKNYEPESIDVTTPRTEILQENVAASAEVESAGIASVEYQGKLDKPLSKKRFQKMLKKAIVQIITGDLTTADMFLLKSLNYDAEQVRKIREEELQKKRNVQGTMINENKKPRNRTTVVDHGKPKIDRDSKKTSAESHSVGKNGYDYEAYNNQATLDYEYAASNYESTNGSWDEFISEYDERVKNGTETIPDSGEFSKQNIVFTIRYNDSEFDSSSEENLKQFDKEILSALNGTGNNFPTAATSANSSPAPVDDRIDTLSELFNITRNYFSTTENAVEENNEVDSQTIPSRNQNEDLKVTDKTTQLPERHFRYENVQEPVEGVENSTGVSPSVETLSSTTETQDVTNNLTSAENSTVSSTKWKGLKWVQDNVYQVIPEYIDLLTNETETQTTDSSYDDASYQNLDDVVIKNLEITEDLSPAEDMPNDAPDSIQLLRPNSNDSVDNVANLTAYQRTAATNRQAQRQKTEDEIKSRVLMVTGRLNSTNNSNPLQPPPEKLAMLSPTCGIPRNTDAELWQDPYSMNMQFQLNLTSDQHLVAARLRLFKLPQENATATASTFVDGVENDEKKIRISVYYYTRSVKKHRSTRKRLMDSKVASLTTSGEHLALDVKDAARHWRFSGTRNTNHGLVVLVEDQEGRPLQPSHYLQTPNCHNITDSNLQDEKAYQRVPALFVRACTRYLRLVDSRVVTYEFCGSHPERVSFEEETNEY